MLAAELCDAAGLSSNTRLGTITAPAIQYLSTERVNVFHVGEYCWTSQQRHPPHHSCRFNLVVRRHID